VLLRVLFATEATGWLPLIWISAALSMTLGNFGALMQNNVKRMLAYSSIAHAGYLLVAFAAQSEIGISAAIFYTASYAAMNVGAFAVVSHFAAGGERYVSIDDYSGLGRRSPLLAFTLTVFMLSLIGIPGTAGFYAKYYVFNAALAPSAHLTALIFLTVIGLVNSAVASYYYLRLIVVMYMREPVVNEAPAPASAAMRLTLVLAAIATICLGVLPGRVLDFSAAGAADLQHLAKPVASRTTVRLEFHRTPPDVTTNSATSDPATTAIPAK
jgi:NADH-quinone oxidoreductase subunit N